MKNLIRLFAVYLVLFTSCTKDDTNGKLITYRLEGLSNISLGSVNNSSSSFILTFNQQGDLNETISLSFTGLPAGITVDTSYARTGKPNFSSYITFRNDGTVANGTYPVTLHCVGSLSGERTFSFSIVLSQTGITTDCADKLIGLWTNCGSVISTSYIYYECMITIDVNNGQKRIIISNGYGNSSPLYGYVNCNNDSLIIPQQSNNTYGTGICSSTSISYSIHDYLGRVFIVYMSR